MKIDNIKGVIEKEYTIDYPSMFLEDISIINPRVKNSLHTVEYVISSSIIRGVEQTVIDLKVSKSDIRACFIHFANTI